MNFTVPPTRCLKLTTLCIKLVSTFNMITTRCLKLNTLCIKLVSTFNLITTRCLKLNTLCIKFVSTFNLITTQCWNWIIHYASNWCQLSTWSQPGVWNWIHCASNWCQLSTWSQPSVEIEYIMHQIRVNFQLDHNPVLKLNTLCIKSVSTFNLITTQCWNWNALQSKFVSIWSTV